MILLSFAVKRQFKRHEKSSFQYVSHFKYLYMKLWKQKKNLAYTTLKEKNRGHLESTVSQILGGDFIILSENDKYNWLYLFHICYTISQQ